MKNNNKHHQPNTIVEGLHVLADWFDLQDSLLSEEERGHEVQDDLRDWADSVQKLITASVVVGMLCDSNTGEPRDGFRFRDSIQQMRIATKELIDP